VAHKNSNAYGERTRARIMLADFDGSSADFQHLVQAIGHAVKGSSPVIMTVQALPVANGPTATLAAPTRQNGDGPTAFDHGPVEEPEVQVEPQVEASPAPPKSQNGAKRKHKTPPLVEGLECTSGSKPLKDYLNAVGPDGHAMRYLAITQWLKEHRNFEEVGASHIYTCYKFLDMTVPPDVLGVFRGLKKRDCVQQGSADGLYKITLVGENQLTKARNKE
jgi:hypothetical protein